MKSMQIYEPSMCCSTGLCGVGVDPELLRISTILNTLEKNGVKVDRFNLSSSPQEFIKNDVVNDEIKLKGVEALPLAVLEGEIIMTGRYPTNEEFATIFSITVDYVGEQTMEVKDADDNKDGCFSSAGDCC